MERSCFTCFEGCELVPLARSSKQRFGVRESVAFGRHPKVAAFRVSSRKQLPTGSLAPRCSTRRPRTTCRPSRTVEKLANCVARAGVP